MLCAQVKLGWQIEANREILSVTACRGKHLQKNVNPAHKNMWQGIFPAMVFSFHFLQVWCHHRDYYSLFNLSDQLHFLQIFSFVVRLFRLTQAKMVYGTNETKNTG